jgi:hypothetical protein
MPRDQAHYFLKTRHTDRVDDEQFRIATATTGINFPSIRCE